MRLLRPLLVLGAACTLVLSLSGQTVRVLSVSGEATLQAPGDTSPRIIKKGDAIVVGTRIITGEGARVILTPLPGVNSIISPKSEIVVERVSVSASPDAKTAIHSAVLDLKTGAVTTDLKPTEGVELDYGVRTARGLAGARGTTYTVGINAAGIQTVVVADGRISLTLADGRIVDLVPGQVSITQTDGDTQAVTSASELSTGDQAIADNWVEVTLDALAEAIEQGVDIDPAALEDAARAAAGLGIDIGAETQARLDRARDLLQERRQTRIDSTSGGDVSDTKDAQTIVTETQQPTDSQSDEYLRALASYLLTLTDDQRAAFQALPEDVRRLLVTVNDSAYTAYALDLYGEGETRPVSAIRYAGALGSELRSAFYERPESIQLFLAAHPADTGLRNYALTADGENGYPSDNLVAYFQPLTSGQRTAFRALDYSLRDALAAAGNPGLTSYALATGRTEAQVAYAVSLPAERFELFRTFSAAAQAALVTNFDDTALADFAYATNEGGGNLHSHAQIVFYSGLSATDRATYEARPLHLQEFAATHPAFAALVLKLDTETSAPVYSDAALGHYLTLASAVTQADYLARGAEVRDLFAEIGKPALTAAVLDQANFDEPPTDADLRRNLAAYRDLSPQNQTLFDTFAGGPAYPKLDSTPGPYEWSDAAWTRTRNSFTALSPANQTRLVNLGAAEGLFDYSATFIDAALADYDSSLNSTQRSAIQAAGWTRYFADYFAREDFREVFAAASDLTATQRTTVQDFGVSPYAFLQSDRGSETAGLSFTEGGSDILARLASLAALPSTDRTLLASIADGDTLLNAYLSSYYDPETENYIYPDYDDALANALSFAREFSPEDRKTLKLLGLTGILLQTRSDATVYIGDSPTTARDRLVYLLSLYAGLDAAQRDTVQDIGLFSAAYHELDLTETSLPGTLAAWNDLSLDTRDYLASATDEGLNLFSLLSAEVSLQDLDALLSALTATELKTLLELKAGDVLLDALYNGSLPAAADLKDFLGFVDGLSDTQRFTLRELGIVKEGNERQGLFLADREGLARLLQAYAELDRPDASGRNLLTDTRQLEPGIGYENKTGRSFFFASDPGYDYTYTAYNVTFTSPGDLHLGATRRLAIYGDGYSGGITFSVPAGHDIYLRASSLVDLDGVSFSAQVRSITMEAATINLANLDFPEGSLVALNSRTGIRNYGSSLVGAINFINNVRYGGLPIFDEASFHGAGNGNIVTGTLANPAVLPASYTPRQGGPITNTQ